MPPGAAVGDALRVTPPTSTHKPHDAVVVHDSDDFLALRTAADLHRFSNGDRWDWPTWTAHHLFGAYVDEATESRAW